MGTAPHRIIEAAQQANSGDGVLAFTDVGSSVLAVRALLREQLLGGVEVVLADAPFVEGAIAAVTVALRRGGLAASSRAGAETWLGPL